MKLLLLLLPLLTAAAADTPPKHYLCSRASSPVRIDGKLDDSAWQRAPWTDWFIDIQGEAAAKPRFQTRVKMLWDDEYFYIGAQLDEPDVWATLKAHDSVIFRDNDFEVFLNPTGDTLNYFEFEINAWNTGWDLFLPKPYLKGGKADNSWEIPGLRTAVFVDGTLERSVGPRPWMEPRDRVSMDAFRERSGMGRPEAGAEWRVNFSRVEWQTRKVNGRYEKLPGLKEDNWVWSPQGEDQHAHPGKVGIRAFRRATVQTVGTRGQDRFRRRDAVFRRAGFRRALRWGGRRGRRGCQIRCSSSQRR